MAKAFTRGGYSFRPCGGRFNLWLIVRKGEQGAYSERGTLRKASDGQTWIVNLFGVGDVTDARPSFEEACDLVMARLPREGA